MRFDESLLADLGVDTLIPPSLARWRPLLVGGLTYFLGRLPAARQAEIVAAQWALPADVPAAQRLTALLRQCPTLHKLGQVLARHRELPAELRRQLQTLESLPADPAAAQTIAEIEKTLGQAGHYTVGNAALAEGSVAVVLPVVLDPGKQDRHGVCKLLKPGISERLGEELAQLPATAEYLEERGHALNLPPLDYRGVFSKVAQRLSSEVRLDGEQAHLSAASAFYAGHRRIAIPALLPGCSPCLTVMERMFGRVLSDTDLPTTLRAEIAPDLVAGLIAEPFWHRAPETLVHGDLHAGNLIALDDGRIAVIDWSLCARLPKAQRELLVDIALAGLCVDAPRMARALADLAGIPADGPALHDAVEQALDQLPRRGGLPGFDWLLGLLDRLAMATPTAFGADLALCRKSWLSLSGLIDDLAPGWQPDAAFLEVGLREFIREWPSRWLGGGAAPSHFGSHLGTAALFDLYSAPWLGGLRRWQRWLDSL